MTDTEHTVINDKLDSILKILNGNGEIGLCAKVNFLWGSFVFLLATAATQAIILTKLLLR